MSTIQQPVEIDPEQLEQFVFRAVGEVGATLNTALVVMGDRLGLYRALADAGPLSPAELAQRSGAAERYVREWLNAQAAGGYVDYDPESGRYALPPEQAAALTDPDSPAYLPGFFQLALGSVIDSPKILQAATQRGRVRLARARPRRPRGLRALLPARLQRQPDRRLAARARRRGVEADERRARGGRGMRARRLDDPDGERVPESTFIGFDYHPESIATARERARGGGRGGAGELRGGPGGGVSWRGVRSRDHVRLPA